MPTKKYAILYNERTIALVYISPHPQYENHLIGSIIPLGKKGKWENADMEIEIESPYHDIFPDSVTDTELINELLAGAKIEPYKVRVCKI